MSSEEPSTSQIAEPINLDALNKWVGNLPDDVIKSVDFVFLDAVAYIYNWPLHSHFLILFVTTKLLLQKDKNVIQNIISPFTIILGR